MSALDLLAASLDSGRPGQLAHGLPDAPEPGRLSVRRHARAGIRPVEIALLRRYRESFSGRVLEVGVRGGGLSAALQYAAESYVGITLSDAEHAFCSGRFPRANLRRRRLLELDSLPRHAFSAIFVAHHALDVLSETQRRLVLGHLADRLAPSGVLIFSAHNLAREAALGPPLLHGLRRPWTFMRLVRALRHRDRLGGAQEQGRGYAILRGASDADSRLTYYVSVDYQARQLVETGLGLLECVNRSDLPVDAPAATGEPELFFVATPDISLD